MLLAVYLTVLSLYRTTTLFIRTIVFFVKWGGLIAVMAAAIGYFSKDSLSNKPRRHRMSKPRIWDTFSEHQRWRNEEARPKDITDIFYEIIGQVADTTHQLVDQGWRQALSQFVLQAATKDTQDNHKKTSKTVKGKAKIR
ncbi:hypothetical protein Clacol_000490 [Clathrus columnatus]|uniref:Uncharacterized protein n=1 Tax=Clathrus columnatus TaxID=1419009 RepID=A0AAV4ZWP0_9AGAM|nr:hypothetical protein Clacol_000490 [Clathrus columnatus]